MKIAIIDDGIYKNDSNDIIFPTIHNLVVNEENHVEFETRSNNLYVANHGTYCFHIYCDSVSRSDYEIYSISILNDNGKCNVSKLKAALVWCKMQDIKIICMSLGSTDFRDFREIDIILEKLFEDGVIIVAACSNNNHVTYPASSKYVIGVRHDYSGTLSFGQYCYTENDIACIEITCHCDFKSLESKTNYEFYPCNSYSAPYIAALVHKAILEGYDTPNRAREYLLLKSINYPLFTLFDHQKTAFRDWTSLADIPLILVCNNNSFVNKFSIELASLFKAEEYNAVVLTDNVSGSVREGIYCCESINFSEQILKNLELLLNYTFADLLIVEIMQPKCQELMNTNLVNCIIADNPTMCSGLTSFAITKNAKSIYSQVRDYLINC